jgi:hypothetical protein
MFYKAPVALVSAIRDLYHDCCYGNRIFALLQLVTGTVVFQKLSVELDVDLFAEDASH